MHLQACTRKNRHPAHQLNAALQAVNLALSRPCNFPVSGLPALQATKASMRLWVRRGEGLRDQVQGACCRKARGACPAQSYPP